MSWLEQRIAETEAEDVVETKRAGGSLYPSRSLLSGDDIVAVTARPSDLQTGTRYQQIKQMELILRYGKWVRVAASRNASAVASVPLRVFRVAPKSGGMLRSRPLDNLEIKRIAKTGGSIARKSFGNYREGWEEVTDDRHPLVMLLGQANNQVNGFELIESLQLFLELAGDGFWWKDFGPQGYPIALWNLFPQYCEIVPNPNGSIGFYNYGRPETKRRIPPRECVHFKFPNPHDPLYGLAPLAGCIEEADISVKLSVFATAFLDNGVVGGANVFLPFATKDQAEETRLEHDALYSGPRRANRTRFWRGKEVRVEYPPQTDKNPILESSENMARNLIAAAFDLPVGLLNIEEKSLANGKVVAPHWQLLSIKPRCQRLEDKLNEDLVPDFREALNDPTLIVCFDNPVDEDRAAMVLEVTTLAGKKPLITQDEARGQLGLPPLTAAQKAELEPPEPTMPGDKGDKPAKKPSNSAKSLLWHGDAGNEDAVTKKLPKTVTFVLHELADALADIFKAFAPAYAANPSMPGLGVSLDVRGALVSQVFDALQSPIAKTFIGGYNEAVDEVNKSKTRREPMAEMEALTLDAQEFLKTHTLDLSNAVTQTYEGRIRAILQSTIAEGGSIGDASVRIRTLVPDESPAAAARIARTETMRAYAHGKDNAAAASGVVTKREWLLSGNPCKVCRAVHDDHKYAKVGEPFVKKGTVVAGKVMDYSDVWGSDAHPNCSCGVGLVFVNEIEKERET